MTELELRKLKRTELLEMLLEQTKEKERLAEEVEDLKAKLADREIRIDKAGTIAQAAFEMNGVLEAAQAAAQQYLDNVKLLAERQESICQKKEKEVADRCAAQEQTTHERCTLLKNETETSCAQLKQTTEEQCQSRETECEVKCRKREQECELKCQTRERECEEQCQSREKESEARCIAMDRKAEADVEARWQDLSTRLEEFYNAHVGLRDLLTATGGILRE